VKTVQVLLNKEAYRTLL